MRRYALLRINASDAAPARRPAASPWEPPHVEYGFERAASTVTLFSGEGPDGAGTGRLKDLLAGRAEDNLVPIETGEAR